MVIVFAVLGVALVVGLLAWAIVTGFKIWGVEEEAESQRLAMALRQELARAGSSVPVGAREIRQDQEHAESFQSLLTYERWPDGSTGVPPAWFNDLWMRRN